MAYSQDEIKKIVEYSFKTSAAKAAARYSVSVASVYLWRRRCVGYFIHGLHAPSRDKNSLFIDAIKENPFLSVRELSNILGLNPHTVRKMAQRLGVKLNSSQIRYEDVERVRLFFKNRSSFSFSLARKELGMNYAKLRKIMAIIGVECKCIHSNKGDSRLDDVAVAQYINAHPYATLRELGAVFGISRQGILNFINTHGIPYRTKERGESEAIVHRVSSENALIKEVFDADDWTSFTEVSRRAGVGLHRVIRYARENGICSRSPRPSVSYSALKSAIERFPTYRDAADFLGVSRTTVGRLVCFYGLQKRRRKTSGLEKE